MVARRIVMIAWLLMAGSIVGLPAHGDAAKDPCRSSCSEERKGCRASFDAAFKDDKAKCAETGAAKRQCVKSARRAFRDAVRTCGDARSDCRTCCKDGGTTCDVRCGDGIVSSGEDCDPPGRSSCSGGGACDESCRCPAPITTTSSTTLVSSTTVGSSSSTSTTTTKPASTSTTSLGSTTTSSTITGTTKPSTTTTLQGTTTTTQPDECVPYADGTFCSDDGDLCTSDRCQSHICTHTLNYGAPNCGNPPIGPCDLQDYCGFTGCVDAKRSSTSVCGLATYPCNVAGGPSQILCDGVSSACTEPLCATGTQCTADAQCATGACFGGSCIAKRSGGGSCDSGEDCQAGFTCTGGVCVTDTATSCSGQPAGTLCRDAAGACDVPEYCTGSSAVCPPDEIRPQGYVCGDSRVGPCHPSAEVCNGVSKSCPLIVYQSYCQPSQGPCDVVDSCEPATNPNYPDCPPDTVLPNGTECQGGPAVPACKYNKCLGPGHGSISYECNTTVSRASDYVCRPAVDGCDAPEICGTAFNNPNWASGGCQPDVDLPNGTACQTVPEGLNGTCSNGTCQKATCKYSVDCIDGFVCDANSSQCVAKAAGSGYGAPCTGTSGSLVGTCGAGFFCCAGMAGDGLGSHATNGQAGRCADCCGPPSDTLLDCGSGLTCCDGECVNPANNNDFCGGCVGRSNVADATGYDCDELENGCYRTMTCSFGACIGADACTNPGEFCALPTDPALCHQDPIPLSCFTSVDPACTDTGEGPTFPNCSYTCSVLESVPVDCPDRPCDTDDDCCPNFRCLATCTGQSYGFCTQRTCQAR